MLRCLNARVDAPTDDGRRSTRRQEMLRSPNTFGTPIEVGEDASEQDRLLAFSGRQP